VRWTSCIFQRDPRADATRVKVLGKAAARATQEPQSHYRRGSNADRYGAMFEQMPPIANHIEMELSDVLRHIQRTIEASGESCTLLKAKNVFDSLRHKSCGILVFEMPCWRGRKHRSEGVAQ
jgi:hypothetical protein